MIFWLLLACGWLGEPAPEPVEYTVVRGDTLFVIAKQYGVTVEQLRAENGIEGDLIEVGQMLRIPVTATGGDGPPDPLAPTRVKRPRSTKATEATEEEASGSDYPPLVMPAAQPCLASPDGSALDDEGMVSSQGLSAGQVRQVMREFLPQTLRCPDPEAEWPTGTVQAELSVGCDGRVFEVRVLDDGGLDATIVDCVADTLRYAPFPAHDLPDGYTFTQPVSYRP